jgi:hypothetical protein
MFFAPHSTAPEVMAGIHQDPECPGDKRGLPAKARDLPLHFQEGVLHGIFRVGLRTKEMAGQVLHPRSLELVQALVSAHISGQATGSERDVFSRGVGCAVLPG